MDSKKPKTMGFYFGDMNPSEKLTMRVREGNSQMGKEIGKDFTGTLELIGGGIEGFQIPSSMTRKKLEEYFVAAAKRKGFDFSLNFLGKRVYVARLQKPEKNIDDLALVMPLQPEAAMRRKVDDKVWGSIQLVSPEELLGEKGDYVVSGKGKRMHRMAIFSLWEILKKSPIDSTRAMLPKLEQELKKSDPSFQENIYEVDSFIEWFNSLR